MAKKQTKLGCPVLMAGVAVHPRYRSAARLYESFTQRLPRE